MKTYKIENQTEIENIIRENTICYVGLTDVDQTPYVFPMNFAYKDNVIYFHSGPEGHHIDIIRTNNKACVLFCKGGQLVYRDVDVACGYSMKAQSAMCKGKIEFIDDYQEKVEALNLLMEKYTSREFSFNKPAVNHVKIWKLEVKEFSAKSVGNSAKKGKV